MHIVLILLYLFSAPRNWNMPGLVEVAPNLYWDQVEITNLYYREYLYWLDQQPEKTAEDISNAIPKADVLVNATKKLETDPVAYLTDPKFDNYPVIGVTYQQAYNYCAWRTLNVRQLIFDHVSMGYDLSSVDSVRNKELYALLIKNLRKKYAEPTFPVFRLPTPGEWDMVSKLDINETKFASKLTPLLFTRSKRIYRMFDSVSEITAVEGVAKGQNYLDPRAGTSTDQSINYYGPSEWLGFRCVCSMESYLVGKK